MTLLLVRHADAGDRAAWTGDDRLRPLSATGREQSVALIDLHRDRPVDRVLSSPARRCLDTVAPLAAERGLYVEEDEGLAEGAPFDLTDRLLRRTAASDTVLCTHADILAGIMSTLHARGLLPQQPTWEKASTWVFHGWPDPGRPEHIATPTVLG